MAARRAEIASRSGTFTSSKGAALAADVSTNSRGLFHVAFPEPVHLFDCHRALVIDGRRTLLVATISCVVPCRIAGSIWSAKLEAQRAHVAAELMRHSAVNEEISSSLRQNDAEIIEFYQPQRTRLAAASVSSHAAIPYSS